jgi:hypothetical protein
MWEMGAIGTLAGRRRCRRCLTVPPGAPLSGWARVGLAAGARRGGIPVPTLVNRENAGQHGLAQGDPARGRLADDAIRAEPWARIPYAQKALALRRLTEARDRSTGRSIAEDNWKWLAVRARSTPTQATGAAFVDLSDANALRRALMNSSSSGTSSALSQRAISSVVDLRRQAAGILGPPGIRCHGAISGHRRLPAGVKARAGW